MFAVFIVRFPIQCTFLQSEDFRCVGRMPPQFSTAQQIAIKQIIFFCYNMWTNTTHELRQNTKNSGQFVTNPSYMVAPKKLAVKAETRRLTLSYVLSICFRLKFECRMLSLLNTSKSFKIQYSGTCKIFAMILLISMFVCEK